MVVGIITLVVSIICGIICLRTIEEFMEHKITQDSWKYQICGYLFANIAGFGFIYGFGITVGEIIKLIFL